MSTCPRCKDAYVVWAKARDHQRAWSWEAQAIREANARIMAEAGVGDLLHLSFGELRQELPIERSDSLLNSPVPEVDVPRSKTDTKQKKARLTSLSLGLGALKVLEGVEKHTAVLKIISPERENLFIARLRRMVEKWENTCLNKVRVTIPFPIIRKSSVYLSDLLSHP